LKINKLQALTTAAPHCECKNNGADFWELLQQSTAATAKTGGFSWAYIAQTVRPPPKLTYNRHILGILTSHRNDSRLPKFCRLSCSSHTKTPVHTLDSIHLSCFWNVETPCKILKNFHQCMYAETNSRLLFQKWSKSVQDKWPRGHVALKTKKNMFWHP